MPCFLARLLSSPHRLLSIFSKHFDQPALRALRVLRPLKLVTGFESKSLHPNSLSMQRSVEVVCAFVIIIIITCVDVALVCSLTSA